MAYDPDMDVLIVDDASAMRRIVRGLLKDLGFRNMREAENGQSALDKLKNRKAGPRGYRLEHASDERHRAVARDSRR